MILGMSYTYAEMYYRYRIFMNNSCFFTLLFLLTCLTVFSAEKNEKRVLFTPYTVSLELNEQTKQKLQRQYQDYRNYMINKSTSGLRLSGLAAIGFSVLSLAHYYNIIDENVALYRVFPGFTLISLGIGTFYYQKRKFYRNTPASLNEQELQNAFEEGKKNADKHIQQTCKLQ